MPDAISIGQIFKRGGNLFPLRICGILRNKRYRAQKVLHPLRESFLLRKFKPEQLAPGKILTLEDGRVVELLERSPAGYWSSVYANDFVELTEEKLQYLSRG